MAPSYIHPTIWTLLMRVFHGDSLVSNIVVVHTRGHRQAFLSTGSIGTFSHL